MALHGLPLVLSLLHEADLLLDEWQRHCEKVENEQKIDDLLSLAKDLLPFGSSVLYSGEHGCYGVFAIDPNGYPDAVKEYYPIDQVETPTQQALADRM